MKLAAAGLERRLLIVSSIVIDSQVIEEVAK